MVVARRMLYSSCGMEDLGRRERVWDFPVFCPDFSPVTDLLLAFSIPVFRLRRLRESLELMASCEEVEFSCGCA